MDMDAFEELSRKLTLLEARLASYERLHTEEISELRSMLQELKMRQIALVSRAAHEATVELDRVDGEADSATSSGARKSAPESDDGDSMR